MDKCVRDEVNVWVQAPVYLLLSIGEVFAVVEALDYAYTQSPEERKAVMQVINLLMAALSLSPLAHNPNLVIFYASFAGAMTMTKAWFWLAFRKRECLEIVDMPNTRCISVIREDVNSGR